MLCCQNSPLSSLSLRLGCWSPPRVLQDRRRSRWVHHLLPDCSDYIWGRTEKAASLAVVSDCRVRYRIPSKTAKRGQATLCTRTASSPMRWGHFKTAVKAAGVEQTDKLHRAVWHQAAGAGLVLCSDLPRGYVERLHYHHPPTTHPNRWNHPSPHCTITLHFVVQLQAGWAPPFYKMIQCCDRSNFQLLCEQHDLQLMKVKMKSLVDQPPNAVRSQAVHDECQHRECRQFKQLSLVSGSSTGKIIIFKHALSGLFNH